MCCHYAGPGSSRPATSVRVPVVFELGKHCTFGHVFAIVGSSRELGNWDPNKAVKLKVTELLIDISCLLHHGCLVAVVTAAAAAAAAQCA